MVPGPQLNSQTQFGTTTQAIPPPGLGRPITNGLVRAAPLATVLAEERRAAEVAQATPLMSNLANHVRKAWTMARDAKLASIHERMLQSARARRGVYDPDKLAAIMEMGGSDVYAMITSVKCRAAASWLRDVLLANGTEKPWTVRATPIPTLPPDINEALIEQVTEPMVQAALAGQPMPDQEVAELLGTLRDHALEGAREQARVMTQRMEDKMEDQLVEGGFTHALNQFIDDIVTYPSAVLKGPVVRNRNLLKWIPGPNGKYTVDVAKQIRLEWERVSPFDIYPSPEAEGVNDGYMIEKHRLSRSDLNAMIGVPGYDDGAIRMVLDMYGRGGLRNWLYDEIGQASAEGKSALHTLTNPDQLIDALQYWGSAQGQALIDWGMDKKLIEDPTQEYNCEIWLIGHTVIKATLNYHPLGEKPYYMTSYEVVPGSFWGNSPCDLVRDAQMIVNAASRALVNNMGIASGPQVTVNVDRLAAGETVTTLRPWKIWQVTNDNAGSTGQNVRPVEFANADSHINELASIVRMYSDMADEWSGIPKYLTGDAPGGAGRTASGLSMLISNAGKSLKQVVANVDNYVMRPLLTRLHFWNMRYGDDPDLKGDLNVVVRGANALIAKESAQTRRNEFLMTTNNPTDMQIVGVEGRAQVLREVAKGLDLDTDRIVPPADILRAKIAAAQAVQAQMVAQQQAAEAGVEAQQGGQQAAPGGPSQSGQTLADGSPITDNFSPPKQ